MPDSRPEEFDEDTNSVFLDLSASSPRSAEDAHFTYCRDDIDRIYKQLGVPWETTKDIPFTNTVPFIGFLWDISTGQYQFPLRKDKNLGAIAQWQSHQTHTLDEVQKLYGKLLHACLVVPAGRAYLTTLESMLGIFHNHPFMPRTPPRNTTNDLQWWTNTLNNMNYVG